MELLLGKFFILIHDIEIIYAELLCIFYNVIHTLFTATNLLRISSHCVAKKITNFALFSTDLK